MTTKRTTIPALHTKKARGEKIVMLTCYDATFARLLDNGDIDMLLVGDSLGMVIQGHETTIPVTLEDVLYHTRCVARATRHAHVIADMPFMSYQASCELALLNAGRLMKEGGAQAVKVEGGEELVDTVAAMTAAGIPVMAHIGLKPQRVHQMGGYKIHGRDAGGEAQLLREAKRFEAAGAYMVLMEGVAIEAAAEVTAALQIPTIGINAGPGCTGQVLVLYDLLGLAPDCQYRFVKRYVELGAAVQEAVTRYADEVRTGVFPTNAHGQQRHVVDVPHRQRA